MQFKKSRGLTPIRQSTNSSRTSPLISVQSFRAKLGLEHNPTLYFSLHRKAKSAKDFQHNILLSLNHPMISHAIYVAPLLLDKAAYNAALFDSAASRNRAWPFDFHYSEFLHERQGFRYFSAIPFLREHVSIAPHERVTDHRHHYGYSEVGTDISWHSPEIVERNPSRLSDFMYRLYSRTLTAENAQAPFESLFYFLKERLLASGEDPSRILIGEDLLERIQSHGRWLLETYAIRQFVLLSNNQVLKEARSHLW